MQQVQVLNIQRLSSADRARIEAVDPAVRLIEAGGWFDGESAKPGRPIPRSRYLVPGAAGSGTREERDRLLARGGDHSRRLPVSARFAGAGAPAEMVSPASCGRQQSPRAAISGAATRRRRPRAAPATPFRSPNMRSRASSTSPWACIAPPIDRVARCFDHRAYRSLLIEGKTACVVGAGGIGQRGRPVLRRARLAGRRHSARPAPSEPMPPGFTEFGGAGDLDRFSAGERFRGGLLPMDAGDHGRFDKPASPQMKAGSVLVNVARGEIVDEDALADALQRGPCAVRPSTSTSANSSARRRRGCGRTRGADHPACLGGQRRGPPRRHRPLRHQSARRSRRQAAAQRHRLAPRLLTRRGDPMALTDTRACAPSTAPTPAV